MHPTASRAPFRATHIRLSLMWLLPSRATFRFAGHLMYTFKILQLNLLDILFIAPVRLDQDPVDRTDIDVFASAADGFDHAG